MHGKRYGWALVFFTAMLLAIPATMAQPVGACADEKKSHQFDFWIGEWEVTAGGKLAGMNSIQPILDGCVLQENWKGSGGSAGSSLNHFDPSTGQWHQFWVWRNGTILKLSGGFKDGKMVLEGESKGQDGKKIRNRITWYDNADGTVRQHWQQSTDKGKTWTDSFDGLYRKKSG